MNKSGVQNPRVVDVVAYDPTTGAYVLVMVENRPWGSSREQLLQLQEKLNTYLTFALDGEMARKIPGSQGKPLRFRLDCVTEPDAEAAKFIELARPKLEKDGIRFEVKLLNMKE